MALNMSDVDDGGMHYSTKFIEGVNYFVDEMDGISNEVWNSVYGRFLKMSDVKKDSPWQPISTAPKDGTEIDIVVKIWMHQTDSFKYLRYTNCGWCESLESWTGIPHRMMRPVYWMPIPEIPTA